MYCCESTNANCASFDSCHGDRSGTLCGRCPQGMSESLFSTKCISNAKCSSNCFFILGIIAYFVVYLVFFLYHQEIISFLRKSLLSKHLPFQRRRTEDDHNFKINSSSSGIIKIFFYYYQVCDLIRNSIGSPNEQGFVYRYQRIIPKVMNLVVFNLPTFNCPFKGLHPVPKRVVLHFTGYCLLVLLFLVYLMNKLFLNFRRLNRDSGRRALQNITAVSDEPNIASKMSFLQRAASAFAYISLLMYASSTQLSFSLLHCVTVGDDQVLFIDGNIKCYQNFQYFLVAYITFCILPFCLVPVFSSYLLNSRQISVKQFIAASIFPLPFSCFWMYLFFKSVCWGDRVAIQQNDDEDGNQESQDGTVVIHNGDEVNFSPTDCSQEALPEIQSSIIKVLVGPFRCHKAFWNIPASYIPWEGFLIFRRLLLIIVLTFVYNIQLRLFIALTLCVAILILHMFVHPFKRKFDNVVETISLGTHVLLCGLILIKSLYYGEDFSFQNNFPFLNVVENILIIAPFFLVIIVIILCLLVKLVSALQFCILLLRRSLSRFTRIFR